jgi:hypothetical protein
VLAGIAGAGGVLVVSVILALVLGGGGSGPQRPGAASGPSLTPASPVTPGPSSALVTHRSAFGPSAAAYLSGRAGTVLAAVYDLTTRQTWTLGTGRAQAAASVVKLDILETLLGHGHRLSARQRSLARRMIEDSDNDAATALWNAAGGARGIGSFNASAGLADTTPSTCVRCPGFPWPGWGLTTTTPADQIALLRELAEPGPLLTSAGRGYALRLMENVTPAQRWGVSGGVPRRVTVALKNGWLPLNASGTDWQVNSVGWISGLGRDYLIAVVTTGNPTEQAGIATISRLSAMVWRRMAR